MLVHTHFGGMGVGYAGSLIAKVWLPGFSHSQIKRLMAAWAGNKKQISDPELQTKLSDYFKGKPVSFKNLVDYGHLSSFAAKVLSELGKIKWGERVTYGKLAKRAGYPNAARAVGSVMRNNPVPLIRPCHRVTRANGDLGGFSAPNGVELKSRMLELESEAC